jgi:hypothetical protein
MIRLVRFLTQVLALGPQGQQALDATFADWRHELAAAGTRRRRAGVSVRSMFAVCRTIRRTAFAELPKAAGSSLLWKVAAVYLIAIAWALRSGVPVGVERFFMVASDAKAWSLVAASFVPYGVALFPLIVFVTEAVGRRNRTTPMVGRMALLTGVALVLMWFVLPTAVGYYRYETWRYFANASVPAPTLVALLGLQLFLAAFAFVIATLALFVLAHRTRRVGGFTGWSVGLAPLLLLFVLNYAISLAQLSIIAPYFWVFLRMATPPAALASIILASVALARIEASRLHV